MPSDKSQYHNRLRELRLAAFLTKTQLADLTLSLAVDDPATYSKVSARTLDYLERGESRPRIKVAKSLARALNLDAIEVFPLGPDDGVRNRDGATRIPHNRPRRGRARKST